MAAPVPSKGSPRNGFREIEVHLFHCVSGLLVVTLSIFLRKLNWWQRRELWNGNHSCRPQLVDHGFNLPAICEFNAGSSGIVRVFCSKLRLFAQVLSR